MLTPDRRALRAKEILGDEMIQEALAAIAKDAVDRWSRATKTEDREQAWHDQAAARRFANYFATVIQTGEMEKAKANRRSLEE